MAMRNIKQNKKKFIMLILDWSYVCDRKQIAILYSWIDSIPFTRKKTKIERDFSDGGISLLLSFACLFF
jgi:hypothetical protein